MKNRREQDIPGIFTTPAAAMLFALLLACTLIPSPAVAARMCQTPDGYVFQNKKDPSPSNEKTKGGKGMGGTGIQSADKGIGGTGIKFADRGIGGTGISAHGSIGVYGRITGFGSVCVNGMEIFYGKNTHVLDNSKQTSSSELKIGQMVSVIADSVNNRSVARQIEVQSILKGPVDSVDAQKGALHVMGQLVQMNNPEGVKSIHAGDFVAVGGFRDAAGHVIASSVEKIPPQEEQRHSSPDVRFSSDVRHISIQGYAEMTGDKGELRLNDRTTVEISDNAEIKGGKLEDISNGDRVIVFGDVGENGKLSADTIFIEKSDIPTQVIEGDLESRGHPGGSLEQEKGHHANEDLKENEKDGGHEHSGSGEGHDRPETESPGIDSPETESPEVESPEVETPEVETPEVETPEVETPEVETPEVETPEVETPEVEPPELPEGG
ncbi:MAG: DUF5666 domain-containing protein [Alphaproteobacteria bacterium]|nr:DUF5666 domain-containing protein [Alphaproteobacteria bacterium]